MLRRLFYKQQINKNIFTGFLYKLTMSKFSEQYRSKLYVIATYPSLGFDFTGYTSSTEIETNSKMI